VTKDTRLVVLALLAACTIVARLRKGRGPVPRMLRAHVRELTWYIALLAIALSVLATLGGMFRSQKWIVVIPLVTGSWCCMRRDGCRGSCRPR